MQVPPALPRKKGTRPPLRGGDAFCPGRRSLLPFSLELASGSEISPQGEPLPSARFNFQKSGKRSRIGLSGYNSTQLLFEKLDVLAFTVQTNQISACGLNQTPKPDFPKSATSLHVHASTSRHLRRVAESVLSDVLVLLRDRSSGLRSAAVLVFSRGTLRRGRGPSRPPEKCFYRPKSKVTVGSRGCQGRVTRTEGEGAEGVSAEREVFFSAKPQTGGGVSGVPGVGDPDRGRRGRGGLCRERRVFLGQTANWRRSLGGARGG